MSTRSRSRPTSPAADERYDNPLSRSDEEDYKSSQLPSSRGSRRDYDGETDEESLDTDAEDRKLEAELWDEEEVVGAETGKSSKRQWVMNAVGKSGSRSQQQYSSVGDEQQSTSRSGSRRSNSTRSAGGGSSRRSSTRRMNELGTAGAGGAAFGMDPSEKGLRRLSLQASSSPPPSPPAKKSRTRCALWICLAFLLIAIIAGIVAGVMIHKNKADSIANANSTSAKDNSSMISGSGKSSGAGSSSAQDGHYASSLNSAGLYPGKASEYNDGLYNPQAGSSPTSASSPSATDTSHSSDASHSDSSDDLGSPSSTDDSWNVFGWGDDDSSTSSGASASPTNSGASNTKSNSGSASATGTSIDWSTFGGHGLGDSNGQGSAPSSPSGFNSNGMASNSQQQGGWGPSPTSSPSPMGTGSPAPGHGGPQQMSVMTWGTAVITVAGGGATALSGYQTQSAQGGPQTGSPSPSSQGWGASSSSTTAPGGWAPAPSATASSPASSYSFSNSSMAVQPESWQKYQGSATWFTADRHLSPCGIAGNDTDYLVALPLSIYMASLPEPTSVQSKYCGKRVTVTSLHDGATIDAYVSDACTCCDGDTSLDLSQAAFAALSTSEGLEGGSLSIIWGFQDDASDATKPFADSAATTVTTSWASAQTAGQVKVGAW